MDPYHIGDDLGLFGWSWPLFSLQLQGATELLSSLKGRSLSGFSLPSTAQWLLPHLLCTVGQKAGRNTGDKHHLSRFLEAGHTQASDCVPVTQLEDMMPQHLAGFLEQRNQKQHQHQIQGKKILLNPNNSTQKTVSHPEDCLTLLAKGLYLQDIQEHCNYMREKDCISAGHRTRLLT